MRVVPCVLVLVACGGSDGPTSCTPLVDGSWTVDGPAMGMAMGASLTMDVDGCTFSFGDWTMTMTSLPTGGTVDGTALTLDGDAHWSSCTGTVADDGTSASGTCADDGTDFTMTMDASAGST